jgi:hypothetical protein
MNSEHTRKGITALLAAVMIVSVLAVIPSVQAVDDYFIYGSTTVDGNAYAVDGYELSKTAGLLYVDSGGTCNIYQVSIPAGADPNMHPDNPYATGTMAPRTFALVGSYNFGADCGWSGSHHAEFYVDADHDYIYYGVYNQGIEKWKRNPDGSFGLYQGKVLDKNGNPIPGNGDETLAYNVDENVWYSCSRTRTVHSFGADDTAWQTEFTYPSYGGDHHDGMEFANGFLWISDMTSDKIGQWNEQPDGSWTEVATFTYSYAEYVEGMGFEPLGHFWVTSGSSGSKLYELGGGALQAALEDIPDQCILAGESFETFDLDNYVTGDVDHYGYSGNVDLSVSIDAEHVTMITYPSGWTGSETITFTAYDASNGVLDSDDATFTVDPVPVVEDIPDQTAPFEVFDLDYYLSPESASPVTWSASFACDGWTVDIDPLNRVTVTAPDGATDPCTITFTATATACGGDASNSDDATFTPNQPPDVSEANPSIDCLWPPNHKFVDITIEGVTDPDGDPVTITITGITSDEPTATIKGAGGAKYAPDADGVGTDTASLRAERSGNEDGRVYEITFLASDGIAETEGSVFVKVPHDQSGDCVSIDSGQNYDATEVN